VDVALYEAVFAMMESLVPEFDMMGFIRERTGNILPGITPSNTHTTKDGKFVTIGGNGDAIFRRLAQAMGRDDLAGDPQLATNSGRDARAAELYEAIDNWTAANDLEDVLQALRRADVPVSKVYSVEDMLSDPQYLARQMFEMVALPDGNKTRIPAVVPKLSETPGSTEWIGPQLGEHTDAVLATLGYSEEQVAGLRERGAI
jgi:formyl-CoA transferase